MAKTNKMPMEWHEQCLVNEKLYVEECCREAARAAVKHLSAQASCEAYERQIAKAKAEGRSGFDRERFGKV